MSSHVLKRLKYAPLAAPNVLSQYARQTYAYTHNVHATRMRTLVRITNICLVMPNKTLIHYQLVTPNKTLIHYQPTRHLYAKHVGTNHSMPNAPNELSHVLSFGPLKPCPCHGNGLPICLITSIRPLAIQELTLILW